MAVEHERRCGEARRALLACGADFLLAAPSSDLLYLSGFAGEPSERLIALLLPAVGQPTLITPQFEAPRVAGAAPFATVLTWVDTDDPVSVVARRVRAAGKARPVIAVGEQTWAGTLLPLQAELPEASFITAHPLLTELRQIKSTGEIELLRAAAAMTDAAFAHLVEHPLAGKTEAAVAELLAAEMRRAGLEKVSFLIVASGPNAALPHHEPGERRLQPGDLVVLDFGGTYRHYQSDMTRTIAIGRARPAARRVHEQVRQAQELAYRAVRPGVAAEDVDSSARRHLTAAGLGERFTHRTGHGLGLDVHEEPYIVRGNHLPLREGMVFSVEPGAYLPGQFGARVEDIVVVTAEGAERLNHSPRELLAVAAE